jgi:hypothetical protein
MQEVQPCPDSGFLARINNASQTGLGYKRPATQEDHPLAQSFEKAQGSITSSFPTSAHTPFKCSHFILAVAAVLGGSLTVTLSTVWPKNKLGEARAGVECISFTVYLSTSVTVRRPGALSHLSSALISCCKPAPTTRNETVKCLR